MELGRHIAVELRWKFRFIFWSLVESRFFVKCEFELFHWPNSFLLNFLFVSGHANHSKGVACEKIKYFLSNVSSVVRFASGASHKCGSHVLSLINRITTDELLSVPHAQTSWLKQ
jgi:hypothetical protein